MTGLWRLCSAVLVALWTVQTTADPILHVWQDLRTSGMGGTFLTTGTYDQNFYGNPARVTANASWKVTTPVDVTVETNFATIGSATSVLGGGDILTNLGSTAGNPLHFRFQLPFPAIYAPATDHSRWALALGLLTAVHVDGEIHQNYTIDATAIADIGVPITFGIELGRERGLSIGTTLHPFQYRLSSAASASVLGLISGQGINLSQLANDGAMFDFDLGFTWRTPLQLGGFKTYIAGAVDNVLGGSYANIPLSFTGSGILPLPQPRSFGGGVELKRDTWGPFRNTQFALEVSDIGNNGTYGPGTIVENGSFFRMVHLGAETWWHGLMPRLGINQGYLTAGLGIDMVMLELELATYGEELSLNAGGQEDRVYAAHLTFHF